MADPQANLKKTILTVATAIKNLPKIPFSRPPSAAVLIPDANILMLKIGNL